MAEIAVGELSPTVAVVPTSRRRFAAVAAGGGVGVGVRGSCCYPCSGQYSNTYQPRPRWCTGMPRRSCMMFQDNSPQLPPRFDTHRTVMLQQQQPHGSVASPEVALGHPAQQPLGRVIDTRSLVPCKTRTTSQSGDADAVLRRRGDTRRPKARCPFESNPRERGERGKQK